MDNLDFLELYDSKHEFSKNEIADLTETIFYGYKIKNSYDCDISYKCDSGTYSCRGYIDVVSIAKIGKLNPRCFILEWRIYDAWGMKLFEYKNQPKEVKEVVEKELVELETRSFFDVDNNLVHQSKGKIIYD